jgi:hypothetical protein
LPKKIANLAKVATAAMIIAIKTRIPSPPLPMGERASLIMVIAKKEAAATTANARNARTRHPKPEAFSWGLYVVFGSSSGGIPRWFKVLAAFTCG